MQRINPIASPIVISAASGTGKTTLSRLLLANDKHLKLSISYTTRAPRGREEDGIDYHFVDHQAFQEMIDRNEFIEWAQVHGNRYGSSKTWTQNTLLTGKDVVFDIDVQGGNQIKKIFPHACLIFILPPSMEVLEERLRGRGTDAEEVIQRRLQAAKDEMRDGVETYDYIIVNDVLEKALFDMTCIIRTHRLSQVDRRAQFAELFKP